MLTEHDILLLVVTCVHIVRAAVAAVLDHQSVVEVKARARVSLLDLGLSLLSRGFGDASFLPNFSEQMSHTTESIDTMSPHRETFAC